MNYQNYEFADDELEKARSNLSKWDEISLIDKSLLEKYDNLACRLEEGTKIVFTDPPGIGKSTAIRQFILSKLLGISRGLWTGIYSASRISDVYAMFRDICSVLTTRKDIDVKLALYTSDPKYNNVDEEDDLLNADVIFCTHERLFIEPPYLVFTVNPARTARNAFLMSSGKIDGRRDTLIIDEFPYNMYKSISVDKLDSLANIDKLAFEDNPKYLDIKQAIESEYGHGTNTTQQELKLIERSARLILIEDLVHSLSLKSRSLLSVNNNFPSYPTKRVSNSINNIPVPTNSSDNITSKLVELSNYDNFQYKRLVSQLAFFSSYFSEKLKMNPFDEKLIYSICDLEVKKMFIFSGTGDLLVGNSDKFKIEKNYNRDINFKYLGHVHSNLPRKATTSDLSKEYAEILLNVMKKHPNEKILVYTWKSRKSSNNSISNVEDEANQESDNTLLADYINFNIPEEYRNNFRYVHYQSGKEQTTSEFSDCSVIVILGNFYIPNYVIDDYKKILNNDELTSADFTMHLMIQCIYRTRARIRNVANNSITLYLDDRYGSEFDNTLLSKFDHLGVSEFDSNPESTITSNNTYTICSEDIDWDLFNKIISISKIIDDNKVEISSTDLAKILNYQKVNNDRLKKKLDNANIFYEYIKGSEGKYNGFSKFIIYTK